MFRKSALVTLLLCAPSVFAQTLVVPNQNGLINTAAQTLVINYTPGLDSGGLDFSIAASPSANLTITGATANIPNGTSSCNVTGSTVSCLSQAASPVLDLGAGTVTVTYTAAGNAGAIGLAFTSAEFSDQNGDSEPGTTTGGTLSLPLGNQSPLSVSAAPQALMFGASSVLASSGGSGTGAVSYAITAGASVCAISASTLTAIGVGSCSVTASKAADANYHPTAATVVLTVGKATQEALTASATPAIIIFGNSSALASSGGSGSGAVSFSVSQGAAVCAVSGSTLSGTGVGGCTVTATRAADANYFAASATVAVTVNNVPTSQSLAVPNRNGAIHLAAQSFVINYVPGSDSGAFQFALAATPVNNLSVTAVAASIPSGIANCSFGAASVNCAVAAGAPGINLGAGTIVVTYTGGAVAGDIGLSFSSASFFGQTGGSGPGITTNGTLSLLKADQTALAAGASPASIVFGASSGLSTTGGSGSGAVSYALTSGAGVCAVSGIALTAIGVGSCVVTASKAGDANFNPISATTTVTVGKAAQAPLSATATPSTIFFGGSSALGSSGGSSSGAVSHAVSSGGSVCSVSGATLSGTGIGSCTVTATRAADANYLAATATINVTVNSLPSAQSLAVPSQVGVINTNAQTFVIQYTPGPDSAAFDFSLQAAPTSNLTITAASGSIPNGSTACSRTASSLTCVSTAGNPNLDLGAGTITVTYDSGPTAGAIALNFTGSNFVDQLGNTESGTSTNGTLTLPKLDQAALSLSATPSTLAFGGSSTLSSAGGSGSGAVSYAVSGGAAVCSISGNTLNATGVGNCTVTATKAGNASYNPASATTVVTVNKANQAPLTALASPGSILLGATSTISVGGGSGGGTLSYGLGTGAAFCSLAGATVTAIGVGSCTVAVTKAGDVHFNPASATVAVTVANTLPSLMAATTATTLEDLASAPVAITLGDAETAPAALQLRATSSNQALVADAALTTGLGGTGGNRSLLVMPVANAVGSVTLTLTVTDAHGGSSSRTLTLTIVPVNDAPDFTVQPIVTEPGTNGAQLQSSFVGGLVLGPPDEQLSQSVQGYAVSETSDPAGVVQSIAVADDGTLSYMLSGSSGIASFSATLTDNGGTANGGVASSTAQLFTITVPLATDLELSLDNGVAHFLAGASASYTLIVANAGPTAVAGAQLHYTPPAGLANASWTCTPIAFASCPTASANGAIQQLLDLAAGGALRFVLTATVAAPTGSMINNTASISVPAGFIDLDTLDNTAVDNDPVVPELILSDDFEGGSQISVILP